MTFEYEIFACISQYDPSASTTHSSFLHELPCKGIWVPNKKLVFHLISIPFVGLENISPCYFQEKTLEFRAQGFQLIHLWQDQWIKNQNIVRSRIAALLGVGTHIHARQTNLKRIAKDDMRSFLMANHLQGSVKARYAYGLYSGHQLVAVASFGSGRTMTRNGVTGRSFELLRYANLLNHRVVGGMGKLIAHFINDQHPDDIMTYADLDWASGKGYQTLHFQPITFTPPQMFWINPDEQIRYYPHRLPTQYMEEFKQQNVSDSIDDFLINKGYIRIYNAGNIKFLLTLMRSRT